MSQFQRFDRESRGDALSSDLRETTIKYVFDFCIIWQNIQALSRKAPLGQEIGKKGEMSNEWSDSSKANPYGVFEFCWYFLCCWIVAVAFHRLSGPTWFGQHPYSGATGILFLIALPVGFSAATLLQKIIRIGVPLGLIYLFLAQTQQGGGIIDRLQSRLEFPHFLLVFVATFFAILLTGKPEEKKELPEELEEEPEEEEPATANLEVFDRIVGQEHVIAPLREIANIACSGIRVGKRNAPHAVLLFLGPTGVGKTEAANALAEAVYGSKDALIRFDMGQFTEAHQANRFYGPPPGYAGYEKGGQLTNAVMRKPRSVVLLDEVEKAHPQIWDAFLPVFDEGYIVDGSTNRRVDMTNTVIVLTSNLLADEDNLFSVSPYEIKEAVQATGAFRPELLGRINEILVFQPLNTDAITEILKRRMDAALWSLAEQGISITVDSSEIASLVEQVKAAKFGVRQIDDVVRKHLRAAIAEHQQK